MNIPTKHCSQCGLVAATNSMFCVQCGVEFPHPITELSAYMCEECETLLPGGSRYCPSCGIAFDTPVPVAKPDAPSDFQQPPLLHRRNLSENNVASTAPLSSASMLNEGHQAAIIGFSPLGSLKATRGIVMIIGALPATVFFGAGFGLIQLAHPQAATTNADNAASAPAPQQAVAATVAPVSSDNPPASDLPAVQDDNSSSRDGPSRDGPSRDGPSRDGPSSDEATTPPPQTSDVPDPAPEVSGSSHAATSTDDTMTAYAPQGSGLSDVPLSTDALRDEIISSSELKSLSLRALSISHNSIYALHGYIFSRPAIQAYFDAQDWYHPDAAFSPSMLTITEQQNVQTIRAAERTNFGYGRNSFDKQGHAYEQRDPLRETAALGSGLDDTLLSLNTLQNTFVTDKDLSGKSLAALSISYNAIYAAHGYVFKRASLQQAFGHAAWYHPNPAFQETDLTPIERANLQTIRSYERIRFGY